MSLIIDSIKIRDQRRQIDQIYAIMPSLIQHDTPEDQRKTCGYAELPGGEYKMCFANYQTGDALLVWLDSDPTKRHEKKLRYIYVLRTPKNVLNTWTSGEVRKLPEPK